MFLNLEFQDKIKIIDTHCHLDNESFFDDLNELLIHSFKNGIAKIIIPGANMKDLPRARELSQRYEQIFFAVGVHPYELESFDEELFREFVQDEKCVAIGECGLDYFRLEGTQSKKELQVKKQKTCFIRQLELAREFQKPVIIHSREANADTFELLNFSKDLQGGVLHCFNASKHLLELAEKGFYFGIGGVLTFKNARNLVEILPQIPREKLLLETDAPYLTPEPFRGKRNEPLLTHYVARKMSEVLQIPHNELLELCFENSNNLFFKRN
ncbi:TatD family hydrolase [Campylobacter sp. MIT 21-1685]|uniref:TatD family hydrolase n=1 Tax=unclassified Campylobacter TaxID=2593542 RepID=UPI00224B9A1B|nr:MULTISPECIES: TatD family hydrolase [unclassified Campylobacter]MCX2682374.1 TatD family hydrolase [Campylobacter sp. MIT 21-1684]MCX2750654.1 TatD family hydrolase [Campylobacter sp. MIT 21-1682]MCX2806798.1 TatD family hydrolase [Campylobacter sp. MIT 21-1685]